MKPKLARLCSTPFAAFTLIFLVAGCASTPTVTTEASGVTYREDKDLQKIALADQFDFTGYDTLYVAPTKSTAKPRSKEEDYVQQVAIEELQNQLADSIRATNLFKTVVTREADILPGSKTLRMENTIIEHEKGGGGARYFAGLYGGGQPVIVVQGVVSDGDKPLFRYISRRSGDSGGSRVFGVFKSDVTIQEEDIQDLAADMAGFMWRTAHHQQGK